MTDTNVPTGATLTSYEDCVKLIDSVANEPQVVNLQAALNKLKTFLNGRIGKRASDKEKDGGAAVKRAMAESRQFTPYTPRPITTEPTSLNAFK